MLPVARRARERGGQQIEALVELEPADAEEHDLAGADAVALARQQPVGRSGERARGDEIDAVRDRAHLTARPAGDAARPSARARRRSR